MKVVIENNRLVIPRGYMLNPDILDRIFVPQHFKVGDKFDLGYGNIYMLCQIAPSVVALIGEDGNRYVEGIKVPMVYHVSAGVITSLAGGSIDWKHVSSQAV